MAGVKQSPRVRLWCGGGVEGCQLTSGAFGSSQGLLRRSLVWQVIGVGQAVLHRELEALLALEV